MKWKLSYIGIGALVLTNVATLAGMLWFKHGLDILQNEYEIQSKLTQEFLLKTTVANPQGHLVGVSSPTIFRSAEECGAVKRLWNKMNILQASKWYCEKYEERAD